MNDILRDLTFLYKEVAIYPDTLDLLLALDYKVQVEQEKREVYVRDDLILLTRDDIYSEGRIDVAHNSYAWFDVFGRRHRDLSAEGEHLPALVYFEILDGKRIVSMEHYYVFGNLHRDDNPAVVCYNFINGARVVVLEEYFHHGKRHRETDDAGYSQAAFRQWQILDGRLLLLYESYFRHGKLHRFHSLPASLTYSVVDGQHFLSEEAYYRYGRRHREILPALFIFELREGRVIVAKREYYFHGRQIGPSM